MQVSCRFVWYHSLFLLFFGVLHIRLSTYAYTTAHNNTRTSPKRVYDPFLFRSGGLCVLLSYFSALPPHHTTAHALKTGHFPPSEPEGGVVDFLPVLLVLPYSAGPKRLFAYATDSIQGTKKPPYRVARGFVWCGGVLARVMLPVPRPVCLLQPIPARMYQCQQSLRSKSTMRNCALFCGQCC